MAINVFLHFVYFRVLCDSVYNVLPGYKANVPWRIIKLELTETPHKNLKLYFKAVVLISNSEVSGSTVKLLTFLYFSSPLQTLLKIKYIRPS